MRMAQFSGENKRPLLSVLSYLRPAGRTRRVLLELGHLSPPCLLWCRYSTNHLPCNPKSKIQNPKPPHAFGLSFAFSFIFSIIDLICARSLMFLPSFK